MPFVKIDCGILDSTIWCEDSGTCKVWITMLAMADSTGFVGATAPGIARRSNMTLAQTRAAIEILESPDSDSRTSNDEGKRISRVEGGYQITNYELYRNKDHTAASRMRRYRAKLKRGNVTAVTRNVTQAEAEAEAYLKIFNKRRSSCTATSQKSEKRAVPKRNGSGIIMTCAKIGSLWEVPNDKIIEWEESFPDVDVRLTLLGIRQWLRDNQGKRKTPQGMTRFINRWMMREQDKPDMGGHYAKTPIR